MILFITIIILLISIHALLTESDFLILFITIIILLISIHALLTESDTSCSLRYWSRAISIHALLTESDAFANDFTDFSACISIHALLTESDRTGQFVSILGCYFYPRSPYGERPLIFPPVDTSSVFLSTLSLRRATRAESDQRYSPDNFYPRSPYGERRHKTAELVINIRFLSTLSLRRATLILPPADTSSVISIHALLTESDARRIAAE